MWHSINLGSLLTIGQVTRSKETLEFVKQTRAIQPCLWSRDSQRPLTHHLPPLPTVRNSASLAHSASFLPIIFPTGSDKNSESDFNVQFDELCFTVIRPTRLNSQQMSRTKPFSAITWARNTLPSTMLVKMVLASLVQLPSGHFTLDGRISVSSHSKACWHTRNRTQSPYAHTSSKSARYASAYQERNLDFYTQSTMTFTSGQNPLTIGLQVTLKIWRRQRWYSPAWGCRQPLEVEHAAGQRAQFPGCHNPQRTPDICTQNRTRKICCKRKKKLLKKEKKKKYRYSERKDHRATVRYIIMKIVNHHIVRKQKPDIRTRIQTWVIMVPTL